MVLKCDGLDGMFIDNPITFAPNNTNQNVSQDPLKPVCPVTKTVLFLKNNLVIYDANTWRPYCHVNDFARLINIVLESEKKKVNFEIFNVPHTGNYLKAYSLPPNRFI